MLENKQIKRLGKRKRAKNIIIKIKDLKEI